MAENRYALVGQALRDLLDQAASGPARIRIGLMASGSEHGPDELLKGAEMAMDQDPGLQVVAIGPRQEGFDRLEWIETRDEESDIARAMDTELTGQKILGAVGLHYPFPMGVTTIGRVSTPARGRSMLIASSTGASAATRAESLVRNAVYGIGVAKSLGIARPSVGILNLEGAGTALRALESMAEKGFGIQLASSIRAEGGALLRGNDLLAGTVDVCVTDTLTGNVLVKLLSSFTTGGIFEAAGWGYGPSVGEDWDKIVSIVSRASGAPVVANALGYTAAMVRSGLPARIQQEMSAARSCGFESAIKPSGKSGSWDRVAPPSVRPPLDDQIYGVDVFNMEDAVHVLWKEGVWAEAAMGCTGPVIKIPKEEKVRCRQMLGRAGLI